MVVFLQRTNDFLKPTVAALKSTTDVLKSTVTVLKQTVAALKSTADVLKSMAVFSTSPYQLCPSQFIRCLLVVLVVLRAWCWSSFGRIYGHRRRVLNIHIVLRSSFAFKGSSSGANFAATHFLHCRRSDNVDKYGAQQARIAMAYGAPSNACAFEET
jgi:hypothetical protein